jgi:hypothetical protein
LKPSDDSFDVDLESPLMERVLVAWMNQTPIRN